MSKRKNIDLVEQKRRELGVPLKRLFELAAEWANLAFGRRITRGAVLEAVSKYRRKRRVVDWVRSFLSSRPLVHA